MHLVIFDIETTGFSRQYDAIIQIGAVRLLPDGTLADDTFFTHINPSRRIPAHITQITGITNAHVADAPALETALAAFSRYAADATLVAHHARFDTSFIEAAIHRHALPARPARCIDSVHLARRLWPRQPNKLDALLERLQIPIPPTRHTALTDARLLAAALQQILPQQPSVPCPFDTVLPI